MSKETPEVVTSASAWKKKRQGIEVTLPSGNVCLARRVGMDAFLREGKIPNSLMPIIQAQLGKAKGAPPKKAKDVIDVSKLDANQINEMFQMADTVCLSVVVEPQVKPVPFRDVTDADGNPVLETVTDENGDARPNAEGTGPLKRKLREVVPEREREDGDFVYVDDVDFEDKMFLFNWSVGGTTNVDKFREQLSTDMAGIQSSQNVDSEAESAT